MTFTKFRYNVPSVTEKTYNQFLKQTTEVYEKFGTKCIYIEKIKYNESLTLGNFSEIIYDIGKEIYLRVEGFETVGTGNFFSKFGYTDESEINIYGSITQFEDIEITPQIGDLIYVENVNKKVYEVTHSSNETDEEKYDFGKSMSFKLKCKLHHIELLSSYSTNVTDIDTQNNENLETGDRYNKEVTQKIINNNIVDDSETNPINNFE
jgi:hypothetical protein